LGFLNYRRLKLLGLLLPLGHLLTVLFSFLKIKRAVNSIPS
jgi:hypothetical protein